MGQQIVYCRSCGKRLGHEDFEKGKAVEVEASSYCTTCLPSPAPSRPAPPDSSRLSISSTKVRSVAASPSTRRRVERPGRSPLLPIAAGAGGLLLAVVALAAVFGSGPPPVPPPPPTAPSKPAPPAGSKAAETWARLEQFAATAPPNEVLLRCEEASKILANSPFDPRLQALVARMRERKKADDAERHLAQSLEDARRFMKSDTRFTRPEEFRKLIDRLLAAPGSHQAEVREMARVWELQIKERETPPPPPTAPTTALGPQGEVRRWLVVGPFPNDAKQNGMYVDSLGTDGSHLPAAGVEVKRKDGTRVAWAALDAPDGTLRFRPALGAEGSTAPSVAFAACWLVAETEGKVKFRVNADTGYRLRLHGEQRGNRPHGHETGKDPETHTVTLARGPNLLSVKVGTIEAAFSLRLRVTTTASLTQPAPGVAVALQGTPAGRVLLRETFEGGVGRFLEGAPRDDEGAKVLAVPAAGAVIENPLASPVVPTTVLRFRLKPPPGLTHVCVLAWAGENGLNYWYHLRDLEPGVWAQAGFAMKDMKRGYARDGPSLEGRVPLNLRVYFEVAPGAAPGPLLIDDVEILD
jgi:hypothetical protein